MTNKTYEQIADQVTEELRKTENKTFGALSEVDKKLNLPSGKRWSQKFGPLVKMDQLMRKMIQNDEEKEPCA